MSLLSHGCGSPGRSVRLPLKMNMIPLQKIIKEELNEDWSYEEVLKFASRGKRISVPATSANLGPGFDTLGLALKLYNTCEFKISEDKDEFEKNLRDNLIYKAYKYAFDFYKKDLVPAEFDLDTNIPLSRGLGSSAACIVMGIMAAFSVMGKEPHKKEILKIATEMEGHPDNVAPAIYADAVASIYKDGEVYVEKFEISNNFKFLALIPDFKLPTKMAREALPDSYTKEDAVFNISRVSMLILSLISGNEENLKTALEDKIHEPYRLKLIPEIDEIEKIIADSPVIGHYLSGAGSTIMIVLKADDMDSEKFIKNQIEKLSGSYELRELEIDKRGAFLI